MATGVFQQPNGSGVFAVHGRFQCRQRSPPKDMDWAVERRESICPWITVARPPPITMRWGS